MDHDINRISDLVSVRGPCGLVVNDNAVDLLEYAFKSSSDAGVYNWNYIIGIMDNLRARNITTLDEAYDYEVQNGK